MKQTELDHNFTHHPPPDEEIAGRYQILRDAGKTFAGFINELCPESAEQTLAIRKVEEAVMWANAGIARRNDNG